jgi:hypothetical protein
MVAFGRCPMEHRSEWLAPRPITGGAGLPREPLNLPFR